MSSLSSPSLLNLSLHVAPKVSILTLSVIATLSTLPLVQVEVEMRKLTAVYAVYGEHADAVRGYGSSLWGELDIAKMMTGTEEIIVR